MSVRDRLAALLGDQWGIQAALERQMGWRPHSLNNRLHGRAPVLADEVPQLAEALDCWITDFYSDTPAGQREQAVRDPRLRRIVALLAGRSDRQLDAALLAVEALVRFADEGGDGNGPPIA